MFCQPGAEAVHDGERRRRPRPSGSGSGSGTVSAESVRQWRDRKRHLWLVGLVVPMLAFVGGGDELAHGASWWLWLGPIVILVIVPPIDLSPGSTAPTRPTT